MRRPHDRPCVLPGHFVLCGACGLPGSNARGSEGKPLPGGAAPVGSTQQGLADGSELCATPTLQDQARSAKSLPRLPGSSWSGSFSLFRARCVFLKPREAMFMPMRILVAVSQRFPSLKHSQQATRPPPRLVRQAKLAVLNLRSRSANRRRLDQLV